MNHLVRWVLLMSLALTAMVPASALASPALDNPFTTPHDLAMMTLTPPDIPITGARFDRPLGLLEPVPDNWLGDPDHRQPGWLSAAPPQPFAAKMLEAGWRGGYTSVISVPNPAWTNLEHVWSVEPFATPSLTRVFSSVTDYTSEDGAVLGQSLELAARKGFTRIALHDGNESPIAHPVPVGQHGVVMVQPHRFMLSLTLMHVTTISFVLDQFVVMIVVVDYQAEAPDLGLLDHLATHASQRIDDGREQLLGLSNRTLLVIAGSNGTVSATHFYERRDGVPLVPHGYASEAGHLWEDTPNGLTDVFVGLTRVDTSASVTTIVASTATFSNQSRAETAYHLIAKDFAVVNYDPSLLAIPGATIGHVELLQRPLSTVKRSTILTLTVSMGGVQAEQALVVMHSGRQVAMLIITRAGVNRAPLLMSTDNPIDIQSTAIAFGEAQATCLLSVPCQATIMWPPSANHVGHHTSRHQH